MIRRLLVTLTLLIITSTCVVERQDLISPETADAISVGWTHLEAIKAVAGGFPPVVEDAGTWTRLDERLPKVIRDFQNLCALYPDDRDAWHGLAIAMGYEDGNDHHDLRRDPLLQLLTERGLDPTQPLASPSTLCRLENRMDRKSLAKLAEVFVEQFIASHPTPPEQIVLDFDATDDPVHGQQEGRFFHGYYDHYCFLPLYVFCGE